MSTYLGSTPINVLNVMFRNKKVVALYRGSTQVWSYWSPLELFAGGKKGVWYDPSDKSTLFQDVAGTIPVTKDGDPIGLMKDKSGNGYHATQIISTARPTYRTDGVLHWLHFDGVDDHLVLAPSLNLNAGGMYFAMSSDVSNVAVLLSNANAGYIAITATSIAINSFGVFQIVDTPNTVSTSTATVYRINKSGGYLSVLKYGSNISSTNSLEGSTAALGRDNILGAFNSASALPIKANFYGILLLEQHLASNETQVMQTLATKAGVTL